MQNYEERKKFFKAEYGSGTITSGDANDKLVLYSLLILVSLKTGKSVYELLQNFFKDAKKNVPEKVIENLSFSVEDFGYCCTTADPCGLKTSKEIIQTIKNLLKLWVPF